MAAKLLAQRYWPSALLSACLCVAPLGALFAQEKNSDPTGELSSLQLNAQAPKLICAEQPSGQPKQLCEEMCRAWPADQHCQLTLRFGVDGLRFVQKNKPGSAADLEASILAAGFEPQEARRLRWYLSLHMGYRDLKDPTRSKKLVSFKEERQVADLLSKESATVNEKLEQIEQALRLAERLYGKDDVTLMRLEQVAFQYAQLSGEVKIALAHIERAVGLARKHLPEDHPYRTQIELRMGEFLLTVGQRDEGLKLLTSSFEQLDLLYQGYHKDGLFALNKLAKAYLRLGSPERAKPLLLKAARRQIILTGPKSEQTAQAYVELGGVYASLQDRTNARLSYSQALKLYEALGQSEDLSVYRPYAELGRMEVAQAYEALQRAKRAKARQQDEEAERYAEEAKEYTTQGEIFLLKALQIYEAKAPVEKDNPMSAGLMHELAEVYSLNDKQEDALKLHLKAFELRHKALGLTHPQSFESMRQVTQQYAYMGKLDEALQLAQKIVGMVEQTQSKGSDTLANAHEQVAKLAWRTGNLDLARQHQLSALTARVQSFSPERNVDLNHTAVMLKLAQKRSTLDLALSLLNQEDNAKQLWPMLLQWQGMVLRSSMYSHQERRVESRVPAALKGDYAQWRFGYYGEQQRRDEVLEAKLQSKVPSFGALLNPVKPDADAVCAALKAKKHDLISYHTYDNLSVDEQREFKHDLRYMAFVIDANTCEPKRVELGAYEDINKLIDQYRAQIKGMERCYASKGQAALCVREAVQLDEASKALRRTLWDPLKPHLGQQTQHHVVLDGRLVELSLDALAEDDGAYLVETHQLDTLPFSSALLYTAEQGAGSGYFLGGDIDYDRAAVAERALKSWRSCERGKCEAIESKQAQSVAEATLRGDAAETQRRRSCGHEAKWSALQTEVVPLAKQLSKAARREDVTLATGDAVTEELLRAALPGQRVIHLATHGFYAQGRACYQYALQDTLREAYAQGEVPGPQLTESAMGLDVARLTATVLAGANSELTAGNMRDGMLDGAEAAELDLSATQLVVLSACETARGVEVEGEGVLGLTQGYIKAGAHNLVASLWQIPSGPTTQLFEDFYSAQSDKKQAKTPAQALREAKLEAIKRAKAEGLAQSSFLWGAFISIHARHKP